MTRSSVTIANLEIIIGTLSWYKILPLNGSSLIRVKTKSSHETERSFSKFLEPSHRPKVENTDNSLEFGKACEDLSWKSPHSNTSSIWDKWNSWKSRSTSKKRYFSSVATVRIGLKVVVRLYGMLWLSAKCPRSLGRWENSVWEAIWRTILRVNKYLLGQWLNITRLLQKTKQEYINLERKYDQESFLAMS